MYKDKFFKRPDLKKLPKYFQIGTVVEDRTDPEDKRLTKKQKTGSIAEQFLKEDTGFSKKKYEGINQKLRRMGEKKKELKMLKKKAIKKKRDVRKELRTKKNAK